MKKPTETKVQPVKRARGRPRKSPLPVIVKAAFLPDMVNHPPHYKVGGIETIDFIRAKLTPDEFRGYLKGNVLKYLTRAGHKGNANEDIDKMVWYASRLKETQHT
jgi:hypothetical protein